MMIIKKIITAVPKILGTLASYKELLFIGIFLASVFSTGWLYKRNKELALDNDRLSNNVEHYQNIAKGEIDKNRVLTLTVDEFRNSNDILVQRLDSIREELKISERELIHAITANQELDVSSKDTVLIVQTDNGFEFEKELIFNHETKLNIYYAHYDDVNKHDSLQTHLQLTNEPSLLVYSRKVYKNKKNFLKRLITLDWKKKMTYNYAIYNSNDLIVNREVKVINIDYK